MKRALLIPLFAIGTLVAQEPAERKTENRLENLRRDLEVGEFRDSGGRPGISDGQESARLFLLRAPRKSRKASPKRSR